MPGTARTLTFDLTSSTMVAVAPSTLIAATLKLLVLVSILIGQEGHEQLASTLWTSLDDSDKGVVGSVSHLHFT